MGFYGHIIKAPGQTQFYFDRKYSNLAELKAHETTDGIYVGRYVLVEYSEEFKFKGIALQNSNITKEDGSLYNKADGIIEGDFVCIVNDKAVYQCTGFSEKDEVAIFNFIYKDEIAEKIDYYNLNYNVDNTIIKNIGRGYDSTVWQKVFIDDDDEIVEKYVMIAELNSVTPTFNIITDAPTNETKQIEVRGDSTNLNYNIVMPAVWGFDFPKTITYNKDGFAKEITSYDDNNDTFKIEDISKNNIQYPLGQSNGEAKADTKQLTINLPSIGNAISNVWDIVYGESLKQGEKRPLIPEKLDKTKVGDVSKIYIDDDGVLYRAVGETYAKLPVDDNTGSLKALQLKMHHYLGTGENIPSNNTIPGAIRETNIATQNAIVATEQADLAKIYANEQGDYAKTQGDYALAKGIFANEQGNYANEQGTFANEQGDYAKTQAEIAKTLIGVSGNNDLDTIHGAIDELKNTNKNINDEWTGLKGSEGDNKGFETIHGSLDSLEQYLGNENSSADFTTMHGAVKKLNETDNNINQEWAALLGENNSTDVSTIYGAINRTNETTNEAVNATINAKSATDSANAAASNANTATNNATAATERANTAATQVEEATTKVNNLIGDETDTEMTTIYGAINRVNQVVANKFSANNVEETKEKVFISQAQKNSLFNGDDRLFYQKTETYNKNEVDTKIADLIGSAPETLNTLEELAAALGDNADIIDTLNGAIGAKQDKHVGEASRVLITNGNGDITTSKISNDELSYLSGVSSGIQEQFNNINSSINSISYAGSSEKGGAANSANKLNTNAGSKTQPVYFENGIPYKTEYTLEASVPSNAVFTDTTYTALKNPYSLTIQGKGTTLANGVYDGSADKTVNITPSSIGAAAISHNHNASNITSGVLPIERGGTGATTAAAACTNLGIPKIGSGLSLPTGAELDKYAEGDIFFLIKE